MVAIAQNLIAVPTTIIWRHLACEAHTSFVKDDPSDDKH